ncbi:hypothetical protein C7212DRAFT_138450, partial [Tuber magnatum]
WHTKDFVADGGTLVPHLLASDKTHLASCCGDKAAWPVDMSLGNITKDIRWQSSKSGWVQDAFLAIRAKGPQYCEIRRSWHGAGKRILKPIADLCICSSWYGRDCAYGQVHRYYLVLAVLIADYLKHVFLARLINGLCPVCAI